MSNYTKVKNIMLYVLNNAEYLSFMNHVLDLANGNSGGGDSESPDEISLLAGSDSIPELGLTKEFLDTYEADLLAMADVVDESRTSQETEQMTLHETNRDNLAIYIITRISRAGTLPLEAERDAGKYLYKVIKPYNGIAASPWRRRPQDKGPLAGFAQGREQATYKIGWDRAHGGAAAAGRGTVPLLWQQAPGQAAAQQAAGGGRGPQG